MLEAYLNLASNLLASNKEEQKFISKDYRANKMKRQLIVSITDYLGKLEYKSANLEALIPIADEIHVDIMTYPFVKRDNRASEAIPIILDMCLGKVPLDFHILADLPLKHIENLENLIGKDYRSGVTITIPREAYRPRAELRSQCKKENNWSKSRVPKIVKAHEKTGAIISQLFERMHQKGFKRGISLEPNTSACALDDEIMQYAHKVVLMGAPSAEDKPYEVKVGHKIAELSEIFPMKRVQVDVGYFRKQHSLLVAIDNAKKAAPEDISLIVGRNVTSDARPAGKAQSLREYLRK